MLSQLVSDPWRCRCHRQTRKAQASCLSFMQLGICLLV